MGGGGVGVEAGPGVVAGFGDEAAGDGVAVEVAELFDVLGGRDDVEVVVAREPERGFGELFETERLSEPRMVESGWVGGSERRRWTCSGITT